MIAVFSISVSKLPEVRELGQLVYGQLARPSSYERGGTTRLVIVHSRLHSQLLTECFTLKFRMVWVELQRFISESHLNPYLIHNQTCFSTDLYHNYSADSDVDKLLSIICLSFEFTSGTVRGALLESVVALSM